MKLIGSLTSPYVRKVRIVMAEKSWTTGLKSKTSGPPTRRSKRTTPGQGALLVMEDGGALFDSRVIVEYVDTLCPSPA